LKEAVSNLQLNIKQMNEKFEKFMEDTTNELENFSNKSKENEEKLNLTIENVLKLKQNERNQGIERQDSNLSVVSGIQLYETLAKSSPSPTNSKGKTRKSSRKSDGDKNVLTDSPEQDLTESSNETKKTKKNSRIKKNFKQRRNKRRRK